MAHASALRTNIQDLRYAARLLVKAPIARFTDAQRLKSRGNRWIDSAIARLAPGVSQVQLQAEMDALAKRLEQMYPDDNHNRGVALVPLRDEYFGDVRPMLLVLLGSVGFVLLIACVNVANLLLARGSARQRELAVRSALGARRGRIVRQLLTESVTLSVLGGLAGLLAAFWSVDLLVALSPVPFPTFVRIGVDLQVLGFAFAVCLLSGLLSGVAPAIAASRSDLVATLKMGGREDAEAGFVLLRRGLGTTRAFVVVTRTSGDRLSVVTGLQEVVKQLNGAVPVFAVATGELVAHETSRARFSSALLTAFAVVALALTLVGIYGVTAYTVSRQTRQVGIRMALGATRGDVLRLVLRGGLTFIAAGLVAGTLAALGLTRLLASLVYGVSATDPATFLAVAILLAEVAIVACLIPATRAMRIDPVVALRSE